ncbi:FAD:protein FMN transferase [Spirochaetia bacterium]|nr:FAD:protein FMN transferase [Spirochaetia bacterium]
MLSLLYIVSGCARTLSAQTEFVLGTLCTVNLYQGGAAKAASGALYRGIFSRLREIEAAMSVNLPGSDVETINRNAGIMPIPVRDDVLEVIECALRYAELSGGAFDPTVGPLVKLWGIGQDRARLPAPHEIEAALSLVNWRDVVIDRGAGTVFLRKPGMALDLGGIAKGYAADEAIRIIKNSPNRRSADHRSEVSGAVIDLGGNIFAYGEKAGKKPWRIGVQDPLDKRSVYIGVLELRNKTVVTSGVYERFLELGGKRYHHILSTQNGYPVESGLLSVTIIADTSMEADALSTSAFALGYEAGSALIASVDGAMGIFVFEDKSVLVAGDAGESFSLSDSEYHFREGN